LISLGIKKTAMREVIDKVIFASNVSSIERQTEHLGAVQCLKLPQGRIKQWVQREIL